MLYQACLCVTGRTCKFQPFQVHIEVLVEYWLRVTLFNCTFFCLVCDLHGSEPGNDFLPHLPFSEIGDGGIDDRFPASQGQPSQSILYIGRGVPKRID